MQKKSLLIFVFVCILLIQFNSGITTNIKDSYQRQETIIIKISGSILEPIKKEQVVFKRGNVAIAPEYDVKRIGQNYYIWAIAPNQANNYTLIIKDILSNIEGINTQINYEKNFSVVEELVDYNVKPGLIIARDSFNLYSSLNRNEAVSISVSFPEEKTIILYPGENTIEFLIESSEQSKTTTINFGKYTLPASLLFSSKEEIPEKEIKEYRIVVRPSLIESVIFIGGSVPKYFIEVFNFGEKEANITAKYNNSYFSGSGNLNINLNKNDNYTINLEFISPPKYNTNETITIFYENKNISIPIIIRLTQNSSKAETIYIGPNTSRNLLYCVELSGEICRADENCSGTTTTSIDGACCIGTCVASDNKEENYSWIGYLIAAIVLLIIAFIYFRYKKAK